MYIENEVQDCPRVLCGPIGTSYLMWLHVVLRHGMMLMIPGLWNFTDSVHIPPPYVSFRKAFINVSAVLN